MRLYIIPYLYLSAVLAQQAKRTLFAPRVGLNWGQYQTQADNIVSRSYWGGGFHSALAFQQQLDAKGWWAIQGEIGVTQRRSTDRNLLYDYRYTIWSTDIALLGVWRWMRKFEALFIEAGPSSGLLVHGKYWKRDNLTGEVETRQVRFGRREASDVRRAELALNLGLGAGYLAGPGYLTFGLRFWHGVNNVASGLFQRWHNYGVLMTLAYWYDDSLRE
ncbi:MAG: PorT family protein [Bacteroidia bacterium]|nr:PorT family protein [Bacteroidia bacterium]